MSEQGAQLAQLLRRLSTKQQRSNETSEQLLSEMLQEQRQTNQLLLMLIEAMGEEDSDTDAEPRAYMDGSPV